MSNLIRLDDRRRKKNERDRGVVEKIIDGEKIEYIDLESLSSLERNQLLNSNSRVKGR